MFKIHPDKNLIDILVYSYIRGAPWPLGEKKLSPELLRIRRLKFVAMELARRWKDKKIAKQRRAVALIENEFLNYYYCPGNTGYKKLQQRFQTYIKKIQDI